MKRVTLDHLSAHLNLSKFSVSRALSGKAGVSDRTRQQVFDAARELGYDHPSIESSDAPGGRRLKLLIPSIDAVSSLFWGEVVAGAEAEARRMGYELSTHLLSDGHGEPPVLRGIRGLIVAGRRSRGLSEPYFNVGLPVTLIGHPTPFEQIDSVRASSWSSGFLIGRHLAELGHRHVAYFSDAPDDRARQERLRGLRDAMTPVEGATVTAYEYEPGSSTDGVFARCFAAENLPTALFGATDLVAMTLAWGLNAVGLKIPQHISVAGCNDSAVASHVGLKLTTIRSPMHRVGAAAIQMMDWRLEHAAPDEPARQLLLQQQFVQRESTDAPHPAALQRALASLEAARFAHADQE